MKTPEVPNQNKAKNEGHTQVELTAEIRCRAYELYEERGRADGHALEDWLKAEAEIVQPQQTASSA